MTMQGEDIVASVTHRVLIVDDRPEIRLVVRARLRMLDDVEIVGEASNGAEALILVAALAPEVVVLDLDMPVMRGDEAIPRMRELAPGLRILLYSGADAATLDALKESERPDAIARKGEPLTELVNQLRLLLDMGPYDVLRFVLGSIPLDQAMTAFDTWVGLNVRILEALARGDELVRAQLGGATLEELQALIGVYAHLGDNLQKAAREKASDVIPIIHVLRGTAAAARRALLAFDKAHLREFFAAWSYEVTAGAVSALAEMRDRLIEALPISSAEDPEGETPNVSVQTATASERQDSRSNRAVAAIDRAAAAIDRAAAAQDRAAASFDELTHAYLRGPGHVELEREIARARRTGEPFTLAFVDLDGLKSVNDTRGHSAGDELLRRVASTLREQLREYDVIVRHGGDEFLCAFPGVGVADARARMDVVHSALASASNQAAISVGLVLLSEEDSLESLIHRADDALYEHRSSKRVSARGA